jgi:hypothetical protein
MGPNTITNIYITNAEKGNIHQYFQNYFGSNPIPEGTKLSRIRGGYRILSIPNENGQFTQISLHLLPKEKISPPKKEYRTLRPNPDMAPLSNDTDTSSEDDDDELDPNKYEPSYKDPSENAKPCSLEETHSALFLNGKILYIQNKNDARQDKNSPHQYFAQAGGTTTKAATDDHGNLYVYKTSAITAEPNDKLPEFVDNSIISSELYLYSRPRPLVFTQYNEEESEEDREIIRLLTSKIRLIKSNQINNDRSPRVKASPQKELLAKNKQVEVMHYVGPTLYDFLVHNPDLSQENKNQIIYLLLKELQKKHQQGIIHTDIKPENICIQQISVSQFKVTIIDWGNHLIKKNPVINAKENLGTLAYTAPEFYIVPPSPFTTLTELMNFCEEQESYHPHYLNNRNLSEPEKQERFRNYIATHMKPISDLINNPLAEKMDLFPIGCILLKDLRINDDSPFHTFAWDLVKTDPSQRPDLATLDIEAIYSPSQTNEKRGSPIFGQSSTLFHHSINSSSLEKVEKVEEFAKKTAECHKTGV